LLGRGPGNRRLIFPKENSMKTMKTASAPLVLALAACAGTPQKPTVAVPERLRPAQETLAMVVPARGVQIYECRAGQWAFVAPDADLFDANGKRIGRHYAGPHWEAADGSKVVGATKARADAPAANAVPWLLLSTKSVGPEGAFSKVTSIQRVATTGGLAPKSACAQAGERVRIDYTADYYFLTPEPSKGK
jgi:hypothetical protein